MRLKSFNLIQILGVGALALILLLALLLGTHS